MRPGICVLHFFEGRKFGEIHFFGISWDKSMRFHLINFLFRVYSSGNVNSKHWRSSKLADYSNPFSRSVIKLNHIPFWTLNGHWKLYVLDFAVCKSLTNKKHNILFLKSVVIPIYQIEKSFEVYTDLSVFDFW